MRIIGFSQHWEKLNNDILFTTFRYPRKDKDWQVEETVQVVYKPRSKERKPLGIARIIRKDIKNTSKEWSYYPYPSMPNTPDMITPEEAKEDGFTGNFGGGDIDKLKRWIRQAGEHSFSENKVNKLTLYWIERFK
jgi:hypothetical protein